MVRADATRPPPAREPCDLVFLDPPYRSGHAAPALAALADAGWLAPGAIVTVELAHNEDIVPPPRLRGDRRTPLWRGQDRDPAQRAMTLTAPLYMLRHGETAWNTERRMQGTKNSALTERGRAAGAGHGPHAQGRARARARPDDLPAQPARPRARDLGDHRPRARPRSRRSGATIRGWPSCSYGQWEGFSWKEIEVTHPTALADWRADPHGYCPPGGETHFELRRRSAAVLADIIAVNDAHRRGRAMA